MTITLFRAHIYSSRSQAYSNEASGDEKQPGLARLGLQYYWPGESYVEPGSWWLRAQRAENIYQGSGGEGYKSSPSPIPCMDRLQYHEQDTIHAGDG